MDDPRNIATKSTAVMAEVIEPEPKSIVEQLLRPESIQRMMQFGGTVLVLGCAIWLWSIGMFDEPIAAALGLGVANCSVLTLGCYLLAQSRYTMAGRGLTLLGSIVLPLNLWLYDAQGLITLSEGGHLWIPATIICGIYALVARILKRPSFVYAFVGGVLLTGSLFLADRTIERLWEWMPLSTLFVAVGWISVHAERLFPECENPFSRATFGRAFYRSGTCVLAIGLSVVLLSQVVQTFAGVLDLRIDRSLGEKLWATALITVSAAGFAVEHLCFGKRRRDSVLAFAIFGWAVVTLLNALDIQLTLPLIGTTTSLLLIARFFWLEYYSENEQDEPSHQSSYQMERCFGVILFLLVALQFPAQFPPSGGTFVFAAVGWPVLLHSLISAAASWLIGESIETDQNGIFQCSSLVQFTLTMLSLAAVLFSIGGDPVSINPVALLGLTIPAIATVTILILAEQRAEGLDDEHDQLVATLSNGTSCSVTVLLFALLCMANQHFEPVRYVHSGWILAVASATLVLSARGPWKASSRLIGGVLGTLSLTCVLAAAGLDLDCAVTLAFVLIGVLGCVFAKLLRYEPEGDASLDAIELQSVVLLLVGCATGALATLAHAAEKNVELDITLVSIIQLVCACTATSIVHSKSFRTPLRVGALGSFILVAVNLSQLLDIGLVHQIELITLTAGIGALAAGHLIWSNEGEVEDESATAALWFGSLMIAGPLSFGILYYRSRESGPEQGWWLFHEISAVVSGLSMLAVGISCRIRATTLAGSGLASIFFISLLMLIRLPSALKNVAVIMMLGGGILFAIALTLSVYRERVMALPEQLRERRGVFRVLRWR